MSLRERKTPANARQAWENNKLLIVVTIIAIVILIMLLFLWGSKEDLEKSKL